MSLLVDPRLPLRRVTIGNLAAGGAIGTAAATVDNYDVAILSQTTATVLLSNPTPSDTSKYRSFRHVNRGSVGVWNAYGQYLPVNGIADQDYIPGYGWKGVGTELRQRIDSSGVAITAPLNTSENALVTRTIPGGFLGLNSSLIIEADLSFTASTNAKNWFVRLGGTLLFYGNTPNVLHYGAGIVATITNCNSLSVQTGKSNTGIGAFFIAPYAGAVNTANNQDLVISVQKATGAESMILNRFSIHVGY